MISFAHAQMTVEQTVKEWERAKAYAKEYLDAVPEVKYDLKPTPDMRSSAGQMLHSTDSNYGFGLAATDEKIPMVWVIGKKRRPQRRTVDLSKKNVTKLMMAGYDFIIDGIKKLTPAQLNEQIKLFDGPPLRPLRYEPSNGIGQRL